MKDITQSEICIHSDGSKTRGVQRRRRAPQTAFYPDIL
jgi:hypothetical protein